MSDSDTYEPSRSTGSDRAVPANRIAFASTFPSRRLSGPAPAVVK